MSASGLILTGLNYTKLYYIGLQPGKSFHQISRVLKIDRPYIRSSTQLRRQLCVHDKQLNMSKLFF